MCFRFALRLIAGFSLLLSANLWAQQSTVPPTRFQFQPRVQVQQAPRNNVQGQPQLIAPPPSILAPGQTRPPTTDSRRPQLRPEDILKMLIPPRVTQPQQPPLQRPQGGTYRPQFPPYQPPRQTTVPSEPPVATRQQLMRQSTSELRRVVLAGATQLSQRLDSLSTGAGWKQHLDVAGLTRFGSVPTTDLPTKQELSWLRGLATRYAQTAREPRYRPIAEMRGFRVLYPAIAELGVEPIHRYRRNLSSDLASLSAALDRVSTGAGWKKFLNLQPLSQLTADPKTFEQLDPAQLETAIERFNQVANTPSYGKIASMAGFQDARNGVQMAHSLLDRLRKPPKDPPPDVEAPLVEEGEPVPDRIGTLDLGPSLTATTGSVPTQPDRPDGGNIAVIGSRPGSIATPGVTPQLPDQPGQEGTGGIGSRPGAIAATGTEPMLPDDRRQPGGTTLDPGSFVVRPDLVIANVVYDDATQTAVVTVANIGAGRAEQESLLHVKIVGFTDAPPPNWNDPRDDQRAMAIGDEAARPPRIQRAKIKAELVARPAIPFVEFPLVDPNTNTPVGRDDMIEVPDPKGAVDPQNPNRVPMIKVRAGDYYDALNDVEKDFNAKGYSLRDDAPIRFQSARLNTALIDSQIAAIEAAEEAQRIKRAPKIPHGQGAGGQPDPTKTAASHPDLGGIDFTKVFNTYPIRRLGPGEWVKIQITPPDPRIGFNLQIRLTADVSNVVAESREDNNLWIDTRIDEDNPDVVAEIAKDTNVLDSVEQWNQDFGDPDYFAAYMSAAVKTHASFNKARAELAARAGVTMFNKDFDALSARIGADTPAHESGKTWFNVRVNGDPMGPSEYERTVGMHHEQRFTLGPIPMRVQFTATLRAGIHSELTAHAGHARVSLEPFAYVSVSAEGGVDVFVGGGGVGVNIELFSYDGNAELEAIVIRIDEQNKQYDSTLEELIIYRHKFSALDGEAYVYAYIWVPRPTWTNPFRFKKKKWDWTIVEWDSPIEFPKGGDEDGMSQLFGSDRNIKLYKL